MQFCIMCSTMRLIFNLYSTFNALFNIQLRIQHSTIHSTLLSPHYFWSVTQIIACYKHGGGGGQNAGYGNRMLMKVTQASTSMWSLPFQGFLTRFFKELTRFLRRKWMRKLWSSILSLSIKRCVCFVYPGISRDSSANINAYDKETLDNLSSAFSDVDQPCSNVQPEQPCLPPQLYGYDPEGPSPSEEDNNVVVEPILKIKGIQQSATCWMLLTL